MVAKLPEIPRVIVPRTWPQFDDGADPESITTVIADLDSLWYRIAQGDDSFDRPGFFGATAQFWLDGEDSPIDMHADNVGDARIAIANHRYASQRLRELLGKSCWDKRVTHPPVAVLAALIREHFGAASTEAIQVLMFERGSMLDVHQKAIDLLQTERRKFVAVVSPTMALFQAALTVDGLRSPPAAGPLVTKAQIAKIMGLEVTSIATSVTRSWGTPIGGERGKKNGSTGYQWRYLEILPALKTHWGETFLHRQTGETCSWPDQPPPPPPTPKRARKKQSK